MDEETFFHRAAKALKESATYSERNDSWTISVPRVRKIFEDLLRDRPPQILPSCILILEEGVRRGLWRLDYDHEYATDIVVIRRLIDSE